MIDYFYRGHYNDLDPSTLTDHIEVHSIATKYMVPGLVQRACQILRHQILGSRDEKQYLSALPHLYGLEYDTAAIKNLFVLTAAGIVAWAIHTDRNPDRELWRETCFRFPEVVDEYTGLTYGLNLGGFVRHAMSELLDDTSTDTLASLTRRGR
jgi:hypothetical protein